MELPVLETRKVLLDHLLAKVTPLCTTKLLAKEILLEIANNLQNKDILYLLQNDKALHNTVNKSNAYAYEKEELGEELYNKILDIEPNLCSKITGMLLELDTSTIKQLLISRDLLLKAVEKSKKEYEDYINIQAKKEELGEILYEHVSKNYAKDVSSHLTGMLLELEPETIEHLLINRKELDEKLSLAFKTYKSYTLKKGKMSNQQELSDYIKNVHINLRLKSREIGAEAAWEEHCQNIETLEKYAQVMKDLATIYWEKNNSYNPKLNGIYWVVNHCSSYFIEKGQLLAFKKEQKMEKAFFNNETYYELFKKNKIKLLDVGSCYNPFKKFDIFNVTALDLAPACEDVYKCDFLKVDVEKNSFLSLNSFDVVVFSLLLEYLPNASQRYECCKKAYKLLSPGGLLIIITPDSKHPTANSILMKHWRIALSHIGFIRVNYEKLKHLHCMAFMKCVNPLVPRHWYSLQTVKDSPHELIKIPQDDNSYDELKKPKYNHERSEHDNNQLAETFSLLAGSYN